ncbi:putative HEC/Ndc80p family protein [Zalerion maritima]|uniref:Kinetochore protein NDC80 n=1 Tax=Zalerion maritima TaxID=339359 RepID=A0AAD5S2Z8_9PEZI|nr:putative HEC/Ndc80p family protein [Zalerion maritima]
MSQDTGGWSIRRPRETLGTLNHNSALPQPPSAMKRQSIAPGSAFSNHGRSASGSRQSLMQRPSQPMYGRASVGPGSMGEFGLSSVKRSSFQTPAPGTTQLKNFNSASANRNATESDRRSSSVYRPRPSATAPTGTMGHQSFFQPAPPAAGVPRDPRPLKDRSFQSRIVQELLEYLAQGNFEMEMNYTLSPNFVKSPTQRDFNYLFQWLYKRIDPTHRFQKNIDQEVPPLLKQMRYPYERGITKSQISAVGGQNWPIFLGLLHWMMQMAQMLEGFSSQRYDGACAEAGTDVTGDRIIFNFLCDAYKEWLCMDEELDDEESNKVLAPHVGNMAKAFEHHNTKYIDEVQMLETENQRLKKEIEDLEKSTPDPRVLDNYMTIMEEDRVKFEEYIALANGRIEKYEAKIKVLQGEHENLVSEVKDADHERRELQLAVDELGISMQDIDRMNSERERLQRNLETATSRLDDTKRRLADKESEASRKLDDLERAVDRYNSLAYQIGLIPSTAVNADGREFELSVTVGDGPSFGSSTSQFKGSLGSSESERLLVDSVTGYQPAHILNLDLRGSVKSSFLSLRKEISERRGLAIDAMMKDHDLLDSVKEKIEDKVNEVEALSHRLRAAEEEYEKTKEVTQTQRMNSDAQIENMEKKLAKMKSGLVETVELMEQRELNVNLEYDQLTQRASSLREELHTETEKIISDVIKFKIHIQKSLDDYQSFVADELEKELANDEEGGDDAMDVDG